MSFLYYQKCRCTIQDITYVESRRKAEVVTAEAEAGLSGLVPSAGGRSDQQLVGGSVNTVNTDIASLYCGHCLCLTLHYIRGECPFGYLLFLLCFVESISLETDFCMATYIQWFVIVSVL